MTRTTWRWVVAAVAALLTAWLVAPAAVPIYDGLGNPDQPYRFVAPPPGWKHTPPPTVAKAKLTTNAQGLSTGGYSNSAEIGPQIVLYVPPGALKVSTGGAPIQVQETPLAPSAPLPADGTIISNVYRITATSPAGPVQLVGRGDSGTPALQMRAPSAKQPSPVFEHRTATGWVHSATLQVGQDIYQTEAPVFGDWALVQLQHAPKTAGDTSSGGGSGGVRVPLLVTGIVILVLAGIIVVIRVARSRAT